MLYPDTDDAASRYCILAAFDALLGELKQWYQNSLVSEKFLIEQRWLAWEKRSGRKLSQVDRQHKEIAWVDNIRDKEIKRDFIYIARIAHIKELRSQFTTCASIWNIDIPTLIHVRRTLSNALTRSTIAYKRNQRKKDTETMLIFAAALAALPAKAFDDDSLYPFEF